MQALIFETAHAIGSCNSLQICVNVLNFVVYWKVEAFGRLMWVDCRFCVDLFCCCLLLCVCTE
uniref:Uncharacterized protein n=1 Tax=Arundo donax TaxID=35708 RepID=A0A0A8Y8Q2_ARUDO